MAVKVYEDGTPCDLTGRPRSVEVRYICDPETRLALEDLTESATCVYQVVVHTHLLCIDPGAQVCQSCMFFMFHFFMSWS